MKLQTTVSFLVGNSVLLIEWRGIWSRAGFDYVREAKYNNASGMLSWVNILHTVKKDYIRWLPTGLTPWRGGEGIGGRGGGGARGFCEGGRF